MADEKDNEPVIKIRGLVNGFGSKILHDHLDLDVRRGEVLGVVGGSGSGKSVLLRSIIGLIHPLEGSIEVLGQKTGDVEDSAMRNLEMRWGVLFQEGALFSSQTVAENIQVPLREYTTMSQQLMNEIAAIKLTMVGLPPDAGDKYPSELSGGMKKRAGLARALALDPAIVFFDEPSAGLDPVTSRKLDELILQIRETFGTTIVVVSHELASIFDIADRVIMLDRAEQGIIASGPPRELAKTSRDPRVAEFLRRGDLLPQ